MSEALARPGILSIWKREARKLKLQTAALYYACRDPRVPWYAKVLAALVVAYAFSPIDLIPDFIPVLGYLDDWLLVPLGIALALRMLPPDILEECRQKAVGAEAANRLRFRFMGAVVIAVWVVVLAWFVFSVLRAWRG